VQRAFYAEGLDVTQNAVLIDLAVELGFDREAFAAGLAEEALKSETWRDYAVSQRAGVTGFPTLIVGPNADNSYTPVTRGYQDAASVLARCLLISLAYIVVTIVMWRRVWPSEAQFRED